MSFEQRVGREKSEGEIIARFNEFFIAAEQALRRNESALGKVILIRERLGEYFDKMVDARLISDDDERVGRTGQLIEWLNKRREELI